jgi:hypothetical protein
MPGPRTQRSQRRQPDTTVTLDGGHQPAQRCQPDTMATLDGGRQPDTTVTSDGGDSPNATEDEYIPEVPIQNRRGRGGQHRRAAASIAERREEIDITVSDSSDEEEDQRRPRLQPRTQSRSRTTPNPNTSTSLPAIHRPSPPPSEPSLGASNAAHDVNYFFTRGNKRIADSVTICNPCK